MKIAIYTSKHNSAINDYNIATLVTNFPEHEYVFIYVKTTDPLKKIDIWKQKIYESVNEKSQLKNDLKTLNTSIKNLTPPINRNKHPSFQVPKANGSEAERLLKTIKPDIILQAGAGLLNSNIFSIANIATINVHHGLSPHVRGMNSTIWCLIYGLYDEIGVTCHIIDDKIDTGPVLFQYNYPFNKFDTYIEIQQLLVIKGGQMLLNAIGLLSSQEKLNFAEQKIKSYYFGKIDYLDYNKLKKNNFEKITDLKGIKNSEKVFFNLIKNS